MHSNEITAILTFFAVGSLIFIPLELSYLLSGLIVAGVSIVSWRSIVFAARFLWPTLAMIVIASTSTAVYAAGPESIFKGLYHMTRFPLYFVLGAGMFYILRRPVFMYRFIILLAFAGSASFLYKYGADPNASYMGRYYVRTVIGTSIFGGALAVPLLLIRAQSRETIAPTYVVRFISAIIISAAISLTNSRTDLLALTVFSLCLLLRPRTGLRTILIFVLPVLFVFTFPVFGAAEEAPGLLGYLGQLSQSLAEVLPYGMWDDEAINTRWRAFEAAQVASYFFSQGTFGVLFGTGLGSQVHLGLVIELGGHETADIPIFHSGFSFAIVRAGFLGIGALFWQMLLLAKLAQSVAEYHDGEVRKYGAIMYGMVIISVLSLPSIGGIFNAGEFTIFCALILGFGSGILLMARTGETVQMMAPEEFLGRSDFLVTKLGAEGRVMYEHLTATFRGRNVLSAPYRVRSV